MSHATQETPENPLSPPKNTNEHHDTSSTTPHTVVNKAFISPLSTAIRRLLQRDIMGITGFWAKAIGIASSPSVDLSEFKGRRFAVDVSIFMNKYLQSNMDKLATTANPPCPAPDLLPCIMAWHHSVSQHITPVYVFAGKAPPIKDDTKKKRIITRDRRGKEWLILYNKAKEESNISVAPETLKEATEDRMKMSHPNAVDHANILRWMKENDIECIGSIAEADQQMVQLERDGVVDGVISEDGDIVALGAKRVLCKMSRKNNGHFQFKVFEWEKFVSAENPYNSKLSRYPHLMTDIVLLMGNDYCPRIHGNGEGALILGVKDKASVLDKLSAIDDENARQDWLFKFGFKGISPMSTEHAEIFCKSRKYMLHAPVLKRDPESGVVSIVPLNPFPSINSNWDYIEIQEFLNDLLTDGTLTTHIYQCNVVPLERKPLEFYRTSLDAPPFAELDFDDVPIEIQPTLCLINWLRARGMDVRMTDSRDQIESVTNHCLRVDKDPIGPSLQPIAGVHDSFRMIAPRHADNEYDLPNEDYFSVASKLLPITDDSVDEYLGPTRMSRPSIRVRVGNLFRGGHYDPKTIKCRNVETKSDGTPCIMLMCKCLSSKSSVMHQVTAVFEDKPNGKYRVEESNCSCKKGEHFCSHSIGFLYLLSVVQKLTSMDPPQTQEQFEETITG